MKTLLLAASLAAVLTGCGEPVAQCGVYAIGPSKIKQLLQENKADPAPGRLEKSQLPADFPGHLLDKDGYYRGMQVYCKIDEAKAALSAQSKTDWLVYELSTDWQNGVYKADDDAFHLKATTPIKQAVQ